MKILVLISLMICLPIVALAQSGQRKLFPYAYHIDDLPNGLRLVTVPTDYPNLVALYIVVQVGSRVSITWKSITAEAAAIAALRGLSNHTLKAYRTPACFPMVSLTLSIFSRSTEAFFAASTL